MIRVKTSLKNNLQKRRSQHATLKTNFFFISVTNI